LRLYLTAPPSFYYGYPEGPSTAINKLRVKGSGNEKEQIVLNSGYQDLLGKVFPIMDLTQRNAIALQEMIIDKTKTARRAHHEVYAIYPARGCRHRRAAATGVPDEHAPYTHAPRVSRAHRQAIPGCHKAHRAGARNAKECARRHGAWGSWLGAGFITELKALKDFQDKKRKSDFRTGAEAMTCPVVPTNANRAAETTRSTSAVLAIMIGVVAITLVAVAVVAAEDAEVADAAADAATAAAVKAADTSLRMAPQSTQTTRATWRTTSRILVPSASARADDAIQQANERLGTTEAASTATAQASATATRAATFGAGQRDTTRGPISNEHCGHRIRHVHGATKGSTGGGLRRVAATFVDYTVAVGKE
jgi:hypothetical protein